MQVSCQHSREYAKTLVKKESNVSLNLIPPNTVKWATTLVNIQWYLSKHTHTHVTVREGVQLLYVISYVGRKQSEWKLFGRILFYWEYY